MAFAQSTANCESVFSPCLRGFVRTNAAAKNRDERELELAGWLASLGNVNSQPRYSKRSLRETTYYRDSSRLPRSRFDAVSVAIDGPADFNAFSTWDSVSTSGSKIFCSGFDPG